MSTVQSSPVSEAAGITYRQLDYWVRHGYLHPDNPNPGTGKALTFPDGELRVARTMGRLVRAGLTVEAAHTVARGGDLPENVQVLLVVPKPEEKGEE